MGFKKCVYKCNTNGLDRRSRNYYNFKIKTNEKNVYKIYIIICITMLFIIFIVHLKIHYIKYERNNK